MSRQYLTENHRVEILAVYHKDNLTPVAFDRANNLTLGTTSRWLRWEKLSHRGIAHAIQVHESWISSNKARIAQMDTRQAQILATAHTEIAEIEENKVKVVGKLRAFTDQLANLKRSVELINMCKPFEI